MSIVYADVHIMYIWDNVYVYSREDSDLANWTRYRGRRGGDLHFNSRVGFSSV